MKIYNYDPVTKIYIGESEADPDPLKIDNWLIPGYATSVPPAAFDPAVESAIYNLETNQWTIDSIPSIIKQITPELSDDQFIQMVRLIRDGLLKEFDPVFIRQQSQIALGVTTTLNTEQFNQWLTYAQALRDFMNNFKISDYPDKDISKVIFPTKPSVE